MRTLPASAEIFGQCAFEIWKAVAMVLPPRLEVEEDSRRRTDKREPMFSHPQGSGADLGFRGWGLWGSPGGEEEEKGSRPGRSEEEASRTAEL